MTLTYKSKPLPPEAGSPFQAKAIRDPSGENAAAVSIPEGGKRHGTQRVCRVRGLLTHEIADEDDGDAERDSDGPGCGLPSAHERLVVHDGLRRSGCDGRGRKFRWGLDGTDEAVTALGKGLDPTRAIRGIMQSIAQAIDGGIQAMLEIDKSVRGPEQRAKLFASDEVARVVQEHLKDLKGLCGNADALPVAEQFPGREIGLKRAKTNF